MTSDIEEYDRLQAEIKRTNQEARDAKSNFSKYQNRIALGILTTEYGLSVGDVIIWTKVNVYDEKRNECWRIIGVRSRAIGEVFHLTANLQKWRLDGKPSVKLTFADVELDAHYNNIVKSEEATAAAVEWQANR